jgi:hypothetical protein
MALLSATLVMAWGLANCSSSDQGLPQDVADTANQDSDQRVDEALLGGDTTAADITRWLPPECTDSNIALVFRLDFLTLDIKEWSVIASSGSELSLWDTVPAGRKLLHELAADDPSLEENAATLEDYGGNPVGDLLLAYGEPADFGTALFLDRRTGALVFAGSTVWMGTGKVEFPLTSEDLSVLVPVDAPPVAPASTTVLDFWTFDGCFRNGRDDPHQVACTNGAEALSRILDLGVVHDLASCSPFHAVAFLYAPSVGGVVFETAEWVVMLTGKASDTMPVCGGACCPPLSLPGTGVCQVDWSGDPAGLSCSGSGKYLQCPDGFTCLSTPCPACYFGPIAVCAPDTCDEGCYDDAKCGDGSICIGEDILAGQQGSCLDALVPPACWGDEHCPAGAGCAGAVHCLPCGACTQIDAAGTCTPTDPDDAVFIWVPGALFNGMAQVTPVWFNLGDKAVYLAGCNTYVLQGKSGDSGTWADKAPQFDCFWEGIARRVEPGDALEVEPFRAPDVSPDGWVESRLHGQYWTGCTDDEPISEAGCTAGPFDVFSIPFLSGSAF